MRRAGAAARGSWLHSFEKDQLGRFRILDGDLDGAPGGIEELGGAFTGLRRCDE